MIWRTEDKYSNNVHMCRLLIYGCWLHATPKVFVLFFFTVVIFYNIFYLKIY